MLCGLHMEVESELIIIRVIATISSPYSGCLLKIGTIFTFVGESVGITIM